MRGYPHLVDGQPLAALYAEAKRTGRCKISYQVVCRRLAKGWSPHDALTTPPAKRGRKKEKS